MTLVAVTACGDTSKLPEAQPTGSLTAGTVRIEQTGNAHAQVDPSTVTFQLDDSGALVVKMTIRSTSGATQTITTTGSLFDSNGKLIGNATGGLIDVPAGGTVQLQLNGLPPNGTIATARFELSNQIAPVPSGPTPSNVAGTPSSS